MNKVEYNGIKITPYYTFEQECAILNDMKTKQSAIERKASKVVLTAKFCTDLELDGLDDIAIYNLCAEKGLIYEFESEVDGYLDFDKLIAQDESLYNLLYTFMGTVNTKLESFDMDKIQNGFEGLKEVVK